jgi:hypothetical protein
LLKFGGQYFWRVTYFDGEDHPSLTSAETSFVYGPAPTTVTLLPIDAATQWRYNKVNTFSNINSGPEDPAWWASKTYDDAGAGWATGAPLIADEADGVLPEPIRTRITRDSRITFYFRKKFTFSGSPVGATVRMRHIIDDGVVIYVNGVELPPAFRFNMPAGAITATTPASSAVGDAAYSAVMEIPSAYFVQGENVIAAEVHQNASTSSDVTFGLELEATIPFIAGDVTINEVLADNRKAFQHGGRFPDYVELFNNTFSPVDVGGWALTDRVLIPSRYTFPTGTIVPARGFLVVICGSPGMAPGLYTGFGLSSGGQGIALTQGTTVKDYVEFGPQAADFAIGRVGDGAGGWTLITPSPGSSNSMRTLGSVSTLRINEWMASPASGEDWIEIFNPDVNPVSLGGLYLSDTSTSPTLSQVPALSFIAPRSFTEFSAEGSPGGRSSVNFKLSASGESIVLTAANGTTNIDRVTFGAQSTGVSQGRLPDGAGAMVAFPGTATPGVSNYLQAPVVINEALAHSTAPLEDAIELFNPTGNPLSIGGWWLSDSAADLQKFQVPAGTIIAPGGFKVFYENQFNPAPGAGSSFALKSTGDQLFLSAVDAAGALTGYRSQVSFGASASGVSFGRISTAGGPEFWPLVARTFGADMPADLTHFRSGAGAVNAPPQTGPVIINEVMYHPPDGEAGADNSADEFIELHNVTEGAIDVSGWAITGGAEFTFPNGAQLPPGAYALLVGFDPGVTSAIQAFRSRYGVPQTTYIFGPFAPKLPNSTARLELRAPTPFPNNETVPVMIDRVEYSDLTPWPVASDGAGPSLQRISRVLIGNDAANWSAAQPTPGNVNAGQTEINDSDGDGLTDAWEVAVGLNPRDPADAALDLDGDGSSNLSEFLAGTDPRDPGSTFVAAITPAAGTFVIRFTAVADRSYSLLFRDSLTAGRWEKLQDIPAEGASRAVSIADTAPGPQRFYRIVTPARP